MKKWILACVALIAMVCATGFMVERYVEGSHFKKVASPAPTSKKEVIEFFSFGCPHCNAIELSFEGWMQHRPQDVQVVRVPATWNSKFLALAKLYYSLEVLGLADKHAGAVFDAIHKDSKSLGSRDEQAAFLGSLGVDSEAFVKAWDGPEVDARLKEAEVLYARYRVSGVPAFVVDGTYMTDVSMAGGAGELLSVLDYLLGK